MVWLFGDTAIGYDKTIYHIKEKGVLEISGDNWKGKKTSDGLYEYPNVTSELSTKKIAKRTAEKINNIIIKYEA